MKNETRIQGDIQILQLTEETLYVTDRIDPRILDDVLFKQKGAQLTRRARVAGTPAVGLTSDLNEVKICTDATLIAGGRDYYLTKLRAVAKAQQQDLQHQMISKRPKELDSSLTNSSTSSTIPDHCNATHDPKVDDPKPATFKKLSKAERLQDGKDRAKQWPISVSKPAAIESRTSHYKQESTVPVLREPTRYPQLTIPLIPSKFSKAARPWTSIFRFLYTKPAALPHTTLIPNIVSNISWSRQLLGVTEQ